MKIIIPNSNRLPNPTENCSSAIVEPAFNDLKTYLKHTETKCKINYETRFMFTCIIVSLLIQHKIRSYFSCTLFNIHIVEKCFKRKLQVLNLFIFCVMHQVLDVFTISVWESCKCWYEGWNSLRVVWSNNFRYRLFHYNIRWQGSLRMMDDPVLACTKDA
jgi:hypothetical protein